MEKIYVSICRNIFYKENGANEEKTIDNAINVSAFCVLACSSLSKTSNSYIDIIVSGITQANADTYVVFCLYVTDGTNMYYLDNETTSTTVTGLNVSVIK